MDDIADYLLIAQSRAAAADAPVPQQAIDTPIQPLPPPPSTDDAQARDTLRSLLRDKALLSALLRFVDAK
ncbi:MAG: hypothetical protein ACREO8_09400 [Luteimonas sp.]